MWSDAEIRARAHMSAKRARKRASLSHKRPQMAHKLCDHGNLLEPKWLRNNDFESNVTISVPIHNQCRAEKCSEEWFWPPGSECWKLVPGVLFDCSLAFQSLKTLEKHPRHLKSKVWLMGATWNNCGAKPCAEKGSGALGGSPKAKRSKRAQKTYSFWMIRLGTAKRKKGK